MKRWRIGFPLFLMLCTLPICGQGQQPTDPPSYWVKIDSKWALLSQEGKMLIAPLFANILPEMQLDSDGGKRLIGYRLFPEPGFELFLKRDGTYLTGTPYQQLGLQDWRKNRVIGQQEDYADLLDTLGQWIKVLSPAELAGFLSPDTDGLKQAPFENKGITWIGGYSKWKLLGDGRLLIQVLFQDRESLWRFCVGPSKLRKWEFESIQLYLPPPLH